MTLSRIELELRVLPVNLGIKLSATSTSWFAFWCRLNDKAQDLPITTRQSTYIKITEVEPNAHQIVSLALVNYYQPNLVTQYTSHF